VCAASPDDDPAQVKLLYTSSVATSAARRTHHRRHRGSLIARLATAASRRRIASSPRAHSTSARVCGVRGRHRAAVARRLCAEGRVWEVCVVVRPAAITACGHAGDRVRTTWAASRRAHETRGRDERRVACERIGATRNGGERIRSDAWVRSPTPSLHHLPAPLLATHRSPSQTSPTSAHTGPCLYARARAACSGGARASLASLGTTAPPLPTSPPHRVIRPKRPIGTSVYPVITRPHRVITFPIV